MKLKEILKTVTSGVLNRIGYARKGEVITEISGVGSKTLSPGEIGQMDRDSWDKKLVWDQLSDQDKLEDTVHLEFIGGAYESANGTHRQIIIATSQQGNFAAFSLFHQDTPEGVQLSMMRDKGTYSVRAFPSYLPNGEPEMFADPRGTSLQLYELVTIQTTQTEFPEKVEGVKFLTRYVGGKEYDRYDPLAHDVAALSDGQQRLAMKLDDFDCLVSVLHHSFPQSPEKWAEVVAERTNTLDALGRPVYRATSLDIVQAPSR